MANAANGANGDVVQSSSSGAMYGSDYTPWEW